MSGVVQASVLLSCAVVFVLTESALNRCSTQTRFGLRLALLLLCAGALLSGAAVFPVLSISPWPGVVALATGCALMLFINRRRGTWR